MIEGLANAYSDEFHRLHRSLFAGTAPDEAHVIQFTASHFAEGVTTLTLAFAKFVAELHDSNRVVVVEANLRRPSFGDLFDITANWVLADLLVGHGTVEDAVQKAGRYAFDILPAVKSVGEDTLPPSKSSLQHLEAPLAQLRKKYRYVFLDTPPVVPFLDSSLICRMADGVAVIVEANLTRSQVLQHSLDKLRSGQAKILGIIFNKRELHIPKWLYRFV